MADEEVVIIGDDGTEHVFPAGTDPKWAAARVKINTPLKEPTTYSEGFNKSAKETASQTGSGVLEGVLSSLNPVNVVGGAVDAMHAAIDPVYATRLGMQSLPELKAVASGNPQAGGRAIGGLVTSLAVPPVARGTGRLLTWAAPEVMDMGLARTAADRREFPTAPKRLVNEGIIPFGNKGTANVQRALSATEQKVSQDAATWDRLHQQQFQNPHMGRIVGADPNQIANAAAGFATEEGKVPGLGNVPGPEAADIQAAKDQYLQQNTSPRNLTETIDQKRAYQARSKYNNRPNAPTQTNENANFKKGVAAENRTQAVRMNPDLEGDLSKEQDLLGALTALENRSFKSAPLSTVGQIRTGLFMRNPTAMGTAAVGMDRTGQLLQSLSPATRAALIRLMTSHTQEQ